MRKIFKLLLLAALVALTMLVIAFFSVERYWPFRPYIDTKFSAYFDLDNFDRIPNGASTDEVLAALGEPVWKEGCGGCWEQEFYIRRGVLEVPADRNCEEPCEAEYQRWQFSDDGACTWWDFAWKYFAIDFHNGKVVKKHSQWHGD